MNEKKLLLKSIKENTNKVPIWLMRQAGRYLPEYLAIRANAGSFLDLCYNPKLASEVTIQPITRFDFDASIIFSDILVIPHALGMNVDFIKGEGPVLNRIENTQDLLKLKFDNFLSILAPVYEAIELTKNKLPKSTTLIGFAGCPWTIATYMFEGKSTKDFSLTKKYAYDNSQEFKLTIELLTEAISVHLINQIKAGAEIIQLFDSWAGVLDQNNFNRWIIDPTNKIINNIKAVFPNIPIIGFPRGASLYYLDYIKQVDIDVISIDSMLSLEFIKDNIPDKLAIQGNLDPTYLLTKTAILKKQTKTILKNFANKKHVFNLGHGILPNTPIKNVEYLVNTVRNFVRK